MKSPNSKVNLEHSLVGKDTTRRGGGETNWVGGKYPSIVRSEAKSASTCRGLMKRFRSFVCFTTNAPKKMPGKNAVNDGVLTQLVYPEKGSKRNSRNFDEPVTCENMDISSRKMVSSFVVQSHDNLRADSEDNLSARILEGEAASIQSDIEESEKTMQFSPGRVKRLVQLLQDKESVKTRENAASAVASLSKHLRTEFAAPESLQALVGLLAEKENEVLKRFSVEILSYITEDKNTRNTVCSYPGIIDGLLRLLMASKKNFHRNMVCSYPGITDGLLRLLMCTGLRMECECSPQLNRTSFWSSIKHAVDKRFMASKKNFHNQGPQGDIRVRALLVLTQLSEEDAFAEQFDRIPGSLKTIVDMLADKAFLVQNTASHILENLAANGTEYMQFKIADCAGALKNIRRLLFTTKSNEEELRCCAARVLKLLAGHIGASLKILNCPKLFSALQLKKTDMICSSEFRNVILLTLKELESSIEILLTSTWPEEGMKFPR